MEIPIGISASEAVLKLNRIDFKAGGNTGFFFAQNPTACDQHHHDHGAAAKVTRWLAGLTAPGAFGSTFHGIFALAIQVLQETFPRKTRFKHRAASNIHTD